MNEIQSDNSTDSSRSFLLARFTKHASKVPYEHVKSLGRFATPASDQFLATALTGLFSAFKDQLKEAHVVTALAMNAAEVVIKSMKEADFADESFDWHWTTLVPFTKRRGATPNQI